MPATVWRGRLAFGLVSIPVRLYRAARRERTRFHHVYRPAAPAPEPEPAPRLRVMPKTPVPPPEEAEPEPVVRVHHEPPPEQREVLKGFEYEKDRYVVLDREEVAALRPRTSTELEMVEFVRLEEIDPLYFDASYYAAPDAGGEKPYAMLYVALRDTRYAALGTFAMHGREHAAAIRPGARGLILHTLFYANEIHAADEYGVDPALVSAKELDLARMFIRTLAGRFEPEKFKDAFEECVRELIEARKRTGVAATAEAPAAAAAPDIMEALRKSLQMARGRKAGSKR